MILQCLVLVYTLLRPVCQNPLCKYSMIGPDKAVHIKLKGVFERIQNLADSDQHGMAQLIIKVLFCICFFVVVFFFFFFQNIMMVLTVIALAGRF